MDETEWPDGKKFGVFLSHDVDRVRKTYQFFTHFIIERRPYHLISLFQKPNPYWCFEKIIDIEKKYDVRSTFFFLQERKKMNVFKPSTYFLSVGHYDFSNPEVKQIIKRLDAGGWEIGLHGSYDSYNNELLLLREKQDLERVLGKSIRGVRQHYLNLNLPQTWDIQRKIGFHYDASYGFTDKIGFRDDKLLPFAPFTNNSFLVFPLTVMDGILFTAYRDKKSRWEKIRELLDLVEKRNGVISFLWHQRVFNEQDFPGWAEMYEKIIKECKDRNAWVTSGENLYSHLSSRAYK